MAAKYPGGVMIFVATVTPVVKGVHRRMRPRRARHYEVTIYNAESEKFKAKDERRK